jgi:hypothetical protein
MTKTKRQRPSKRSPSKPASGKRSHSSPPSHVPTRGLCGWITHTELASTDPAATKIWCAKVLGWKFKPSFPTPTGHYDLLSYSDKGGGGIRATKPSETPGSSLSVNVADTRAGAPPRWSHPPSSGSARPSPRRLRGAPLQIGLRSRAVRKSTRMLLKEEFPNGAVTELTSVRD